MGASSSVRVVMLGLGVVGSGVARALTERADTYARRVGVPLELRKVLVRSAEKPRDIALASGVLTADPEEALSTECDIVIEVIGGEEPAHAYIKRCLEQRRYVVTGNKEVMAKHGPQLLSMATGAGVDILYEASVGGGIPIVSPLKRDLSANDITSLRAIINGTTNYILTRMSRDGADFADALAGAQELGYAEADPTNDIEGHDAVYKLAILASLAFHTTVRPNWEVFNLMMQFVAKLVGAAEPVQLTESVDASLRNPQVPVHPKVARDLGVKWADERTRYLNRGRQVTWESYIRSYIEHYG